MLHCKEREGTKVTFLSVPFSSRMLGRVPTLGGISKLELLSYVFLQWKENVDKVHEGDLPVKHTSGCVASQLESLPSADLPS